MPTAIGVGLGTAFGADGGGSAPIVVPPLPATGLISEWRFAEGSGTTVADSVGANTINLNLPTTPNFTWQPYGVSLAAGLIQTPSLTSVRTVAMLCRVVRGEVSGFMLSGGSGGSGTGLLGDNFAPSTYTFYIGCGQGVAPMRQVQTSGKAISRVNRGGWMLIICEFTSASSSPIGFGGRHSTTTSRCTQYEIMWGAAWTGQLTSQDRSDMYGYVRNLAKLRSKPIDYRDCATTYDCVLLLGQSNADGRAPKSLLSAPDQARTTPDVRIMPAGGSSGATVVYPPATLVLGTNQQQTLPAVNFGPEMGAAWSHEDGSHPRVLTFSKTATGSTWLVASSSGLSTSPTSWNANEVQTSGMLWSALKNWWDVEQEALNNGVGPRLRGLWWMQGEQDATDATLVASGAYQANLQALYDAVVLHTAAAALPIAVGRIRNQDPLMDATAAAAVRAAQAAFVAANPSVATLLDTDSYALQADNVHYTAAGQKSLGQAFYSATSLA